jgi:hypothetical protein
LYFFATYRGADGRLMVPSGRWSGLDPAEGRSFGAPLLQSSPITRSPDTLDEAQSLRRRCDGSNLANKLPEQTDAGDALGTTGPACSSKRTPIHYRCC